MATTRIRVTGIAALAAICSMCAALSFHPAQKSVLAASPTAVTAAPSPAVPSYLLMEYEGELCVFSGQTLVEHTGIPVSALPAADRSLLQQGIPAQSRQELYALLEDLAS